MQKNLEIDVKVHISIKETNLKTPNPNDLDPVKVIGLPNPFCHENFNIFKKVSQNKI